MSDAAVIGGGPGGYTCAVRLAQLGGSVCLIEKEGLGGTCPQRGCISTEYPSLLGRCNQESYKNAKKSGLNFGMELDYKILKSRMQATVSRLASGIKLLLKTNGVDLIDGTANIV